jgi:hypothetical protein
VKANNETQLIGQPAATVSQLGQTYGIDTDLLGRAMGIPPRLFGVQESVNSRNATLLDGMFGFGWSL